ncbi:hypothetical protein BH09PAT1_BH09PAT1_4590 [soil metagenome]
MNGLIKFLSSDRTIWLSIITSMCFIVVSIFLTGLFYRNLPPLIPLFNQLPWGTDRLIDKVGLIIPSIIGLVILISNAFSTRYIYDKMPITARMLNVTTVIITLLGLVFVFRTIQLIL